MSSTAASRTTQHRLAWLEPEALRRARLSVVPRRRVQASRFPFVTLVSLILLGGVIGLLCFNTSMQQAAFTEAKLQKQATTLAAQQQTLEMQVEGLRDPQRVAERAEKQGMVIPANVAMLHVATGKVSGDATPANGDATPPLWPSIRKPSFR
jgi:cell division protein FtsL